MAGEKFTREKFEEQRVLRCSWRKDVASTMAQTKLIYSYLIQGIKAKLLSVGPTLHKSTDATSVTQAQPSYNDHQQKSTALTQKGTPLKVNTIIAQEKKQRQCS